MKKAKGLFILAALMGVCLLSTFAFATVFRVVARADGWLPATATSTSWSSQGERATFVAQDGVVYRIMLPAGKYSSYVGGSKQHEIIYNVRNPPSFFLLNEVRIFAFIFFFFFYLWLGSAIYGRYRPISSV